jgi:hypothetical protein
MCFLLAIENKFQCTKVSIFEFHMQKLHGFQFSMIDELQSQQEPHATSYKLQDVFGEWYDFKYLNILQSFENKDCDPIHTIEILN